MKVQQDKKKWKYGWRPWLLDGMSIDDKLHLVITTQTPKGIKVQSHRNTRSIQRTQTPPRLWPLTWGNTSRSRNVMSLVLNVAFCMYLVTRYDVCEYNSFARYDHKFIFCDRRPSSSVKVAFTLIIRWTSCCCILVPSMKIVCSMKFEIWKIV